MAKVTIERDGKARVYEVSDEQFDKVRMVLWSAEPFAMKLWTHADIAQMHEDLYGEEADEAFCREVAGEVNMDVFEDSREDEWSEVVRAIKAVKGREA